jgi:YtcA family
MNAPRPSGCTRTIIPMLAPAILCTGCTHSPTISIFGSFFPTWLLLALLGVLFAFVVRGVCVARHWDAALPAPVVFYLACAAAFTFGSYLVWLS